MKRNRLQLAGVIVLLISIFMNITCYMRRNEIKREYLDSAYLNLLNVSVLLSSLESMSKTAGRRRTVTVYTPSLKRWKQRAAASMMP